MSEKRFIVDEDSYLLDTKNKVIFGYNVNSGLVDLLNFQDEEIQIFKGGINDLLQRIKELNEENEQLKRRLEKINGGYGHLTHYKGLTANEWLIDSQEKEIKRKDEQISAWIEQHSKDIIKIGEQNKLIQKLKEENERLKENYSNMMIEDEVKPSKKIKKGIGSRYCYIGRDLYE